MAHFFRYFPTVEYDLLKNDKKVVVTNILLRFKLAEVLQQKSAVYYDYVVKETDTPDAIAYKYYGDETLDWLLFLINDITDPLYDWPLNPRSFEEFIVDKYGSISSALGTVHHYEKIIQAAKIYQGEPLAERVIRVDETTYNTLNEDERRSVSNYDYELELNEEKRQIKILDKKYLTGVLNQVRSVLRD